MYNIKEVELIKVFALSSFNTPEEYNVECKRKWSFYRYKHGIAKGTHSLNIMWKDIHTMIFFWWFWCFFVQLWFIQVGCIKYFSAKNIHFRLPTILLGHKLFAKCFVQCGFSWFFFEYARGQIYGIVVELFVCVLLICLFHWAQFYSFTDNKTHSNIFRLIT